MGGGSQSLGAATTDEKDGPQAARGEVEENGRVRPPPGRGL